MTNRLGALCAAGVSALVVLTAGPAAADPWEGLWADGPQACRLRPGDGAQAPQRYSRTAISGHEYDCEVQKVAPVAGLKAWLLDTVCSAEGATVEGRDLIMLTEDGRLAHFTSTGALVELVRCR